MVMALLKQVGFFSGAQKKYPMNAGGTWSTGSLPSLDGAVAVAVSGSIRVFRSPWILANVVPCVMISGA